jgi:DNA modification methylase
LKKPPKKSASKAAAEALSLSPRSGALLARRIEVWPLDRLLPYARNARTHSASQVQQIAGSIARFGFNAPILVDGRDGIVAGHGRLAAARSLGLTEVPVVVLDHLSETDRRAYLLADNRLSDLAGWNEPLLAEELADLEGLGVAAADMGFSRNDQDELARSIAGSAAVHDVDPQPLPEEPLSRPGDLWVVGPHRILCGDARRPGDLSRLLAGERVDAVITDPPYGVAYVGKTGAALKIQNDQPSDLADLLARSLGAALEVCRPGAPWYVFGPSGGDQFMEFIGVLHRLGVWRQTLVWVKDRMVMGRSDYHYRHENIFHGSAPALPAPADPSAPVEYETRHDSLFYGWAPGGPHRTPPDRNWDTVWEFARPSANRDHPTMKPIELVGQCVDHAAAPGRLVLDLFLGSGTTIVACHQLGRRGAGLEVDPRYCDVTVRRAADATGVEPYIDGGPSWSDLAAERGR